MTLPAFSPLLLPRLFDQPQLLIVVDTEEEFDWSKPFDRGSTGSGSIPGQARAHALFDRYGVVPTYVMDYPVATNVKAAAFLRGLVDEGRADFGTHCHPWVTPPYEEAVNAFNSYHGNLPPALEAAKLRVTTDAVAQAMGRAPTVFKAGRYGLGPRTFDTLRELGYTVDCSFVPFTDFGEDGGPDYADVPASPFFVDERHSLLEVPLTVGYAGAWAALGRAYSSWLHHPLALRMKLPSWTSRLSLMERIRLSPEGYSAEDQCRLLRSLIGQGQQIFVMSYHSPSLSPGHTPYVRDERDLQNFLHCIETVLRYFRDELGGAFTSVKALEAQARRPQRVA